MQYVPAPSTGIAAQTALRRRELNLELYDELHNEFSNFLNLVQEEEGAANAEEEGAAEPTLESQSRATT
jgi:hypothetical protein